MEGVSIVGVYACACAMFDSGEKYFNVVKHYNGMVV